MNDRPDDNGSRRESREDRLGASLRANLQRRKAQARARAQAQAPAAQDQDGQPTRDTGKDDA